MDDTRRDESQAAAATVADDGTKQVVGPVPIPIDVPQDTATPSVGTLQPGQMVAGRYRIDHLLGVGGMGAVYKATDDRLSRAVALKTLAPFATNDPDSRRRFETEARAASAIHHPGVVAVYDFGVDGHVPFIVLELLRGEDLSAVLKRQTRMDVAEAIDIMLGVCAGVCAAHEAGVIHRDLKPSNIFVVSTGAVQAVKVLDFGVSKIVTSRDCSQTGKSDVMGTLEYMSPEQALGRSVGQYSDQFSLGVILYRCLTGHSPHRGASAADTLRRLLTGDFPRPRELVPDLPFAIEDLICRTIAGEAEKRWPSVHQLGRELLPYASERGRRQWLDTFECPTPSIQAPAPAAPAASSRAGLGTQTFPAAVTVIQGDQRTLPELPPTHTMQKVPSGTVQPVIGSIDISSIAKPASGRSWRRWAVIGGIGILATTGGLAALVFRPGSPGDPVVAPPALVSAPSPVPVLPVDAAAPRDVRVSPPDTQLVGAPAETESVDQSKAARPRKPRSAAIKFTPNGVPILR